MRFLLDTHTFIWFINGDDELSLSARQAIVDAEDNYISVASLWEISIKVSLNKLELKTAFNEIASQIVTNGFQILPLTFEDTEMLLKLPFHHRDPFDRMIIVQAINNDLMVISRDSSFQAYNVKVVW